MNMRTINEVAAHYNVCHLVVRQWIKDGSLSAVDVSRKGASHKQWRVSDEHLVEFDRKRNSQPQPKHPAKRRREIPKLV